MDHLVADRVELRDRFAELLALAGVLLGGLVGALREPPTESARIEIRPPSSVFIVCVQPSPSSPSSRSSGIRTSSSSISQVGEQLSPILSQTVVTSNPSSAGSTMNVEMPS